LLAALDISAAQLLAQPELASVLLYHVVAGEVFSGDLVAGDVPTLLDDNDVTIGFNGGVYVNDAKVVLADLEALNGVVHVIDKVLIPEDFELVNIFETVVDIALSSPDFSILVAALTEANLVGALQGDGPFTVFAPTNAAFEALLAALDISAAQLLAQPDLAKVLLYHVVSGKIFAEDIENNTVVETLNVGQNLTFTLGSVFINDDATVTTADLEALNGVVHVIDSVLIPANFTLVVDVDDDDDEIVAPTFETVVDIALSSPDFSILVAALTKAGLVDALLGDGPFTVFAPTNAAFEALLEELGITAEELLESEDLAKVLLYHVISGKVFSTDITDGLEAPTLNDGLKLVFTLGSVIINGDVNVIQADIEAGNGIVHVIDAVLVPSNFALDGADELPDTSDTSNLGWIILLLALGLGLVVVSYSKKEQAE
jgi:transforming growth factor-beta-induced protein